MEGQVLIKKIPFQVNRYVNFGQALYVTGNIKELGNWDINQAVRLECIQDTLWRTQVQLPSQNNENKLNSDIVEFKFFVSNYDGPKNLTNTYWDEGANKHLNVFLFDDQNYLGNFKSYEESLYSQLILPFRINTKHLFYNFYNGNNSCQQNQKKSQRINSEIKLLSRYLPVNKSNSIFVRYDDQRSDFMQALISGADDTPYANGLFLFDIFFDDSYPDNPPKMKLSTTGQGQIRFNPNLYSDGYICLSIIGTWSGNAEEKWQPQKSNILQVLLSIQSLVMTEDVYFNEPGYQSQKNLPEGKLKNLGYSNIVKYGNVKFAMLDQLRNPPLGFEDVVKRHFYFKKNEILACCDKWIKEAVVCDQNNNNTIYSGLVSSHNSSFCQKFTGQQNAYSQSLIEEVKTLQQELDKLTLN